MDRDVFQRMADNWPSEFVARTAIQRFSGDMITPGYMANLDSKGKGPAGKIKIGGRIGYDKQQLIEWMRNRTEKNVEVA